MRYTKIVVTSVVSIGSTQVQAGPIDWVQWSGNGHFYGVHEEQESWTDARQNALDHGGYLATIASQEEQDFIFNDLLLPYLGNGVVDRAFWLGGSDEQEEGIWRWMDGPEANQVFFEAATGGKNGTPANFVGYSSWGIAQPDNFLGEEHYLGARIVTGNWNDFSDTAGIGQTPGPGLFSIVERVPAPSTAALALLGLAGIISARRKTKKGE